MGKLYTHVLTAAVVILALAARPAAADEYHDRNDCFTITIPDGWVRIPNENLQMAAGLVLSDSPSEAICMKAAFQQPDPDWFHYPYMVINYMPYDGDKQPAESQISDLTKLMLGVDLADLAKKSNRPASKGILGASIESADWDYARHTLYTITHASVKYMGLCKGYYPWFFGRHGVVMIEFCDIDEKFDAEVPLFRKAAGSFRFDAGYGYDSTYRAPLPPTNYADMGPYLELYSLIALVASVMGITALIARLHQKRARALLAALAAQAPDDFPLPKSPPRDSKIFR